MTFHGLKENFNLDVFSKKKNNLTNLLSKKRTGLDGELELLIIRKAER